MVRRLLATYLTITALTLAIVVVPLGRVFADREQSRLTFDIERDAQAVASLVEDALEAGVRPAITETLDSYRDRGGRIVVVDPDGLSVADSDAPAGSPPRDFSTRPEIIEALDGTRSGGIRPSETVGSDLLYVAVPVASGGAIHGAVRITYPTSTVDARIRSTWLRLALLSLVVLGLVATVGFVFAGWVSHPVRQLEAAAAQLAAGNLAVRVDADQGPAELRGLAATFNRTAAQLQQLLESQHRFVADASHQLRTPLTALRLRLETLGPHVADEARPKLEAAIDETNRLGRLVHSLLVLARSIGSESAWVFAVPGAVEQILDNLLSNALDAVSDGTDITVRVSEVPQSGAGTAVELHVTDRGPGMEADARAHAFERFWRPAPADATAGAGFGLGLAIVERLATQSGGRARLDPGVDGVGLDAVVTFTSAPPPRENPYLKLTSA